MCPPKLEPDGQISSVTDSGGQRSETLGAVHVHPFGISANFRITSGHQRGAAGVDTDRGYSSYPTYCVVGTHVVKKNSSIRLPIEEGPIGNRKPLNDQF